MSSILSDLRDLRTLADQTCSRGFSCLITTRLHFEIYLLIHQGISFDPYVQLRKDFDSRNKHEASFDN